MSSTTIPSSLLSPTLSSFKLSFPSTKLQPLRPQFRRHRIGFSFSSPKPPTFSPWKRFAVNDNNKESDNGDVLTGLDEAEKEARGNSTMPERFRYLAKEVPSPPVRWPWLVVLAFLVYAWRAVLFELSNWKNGAFAIVRFVGYVLKYAFAVVYQFIGSPITFSIRCMEDLFYTVRACYSWIIHNAPVTDLTTIIVLASIVVAIAEATVPNSINDQHNVLTVSGLIGYAAVRGYISELFFWTLLLGVYAFSKFVKKRDDVSAAMPVAAVLAGVGEPWVRALVIISYTALAIYQYSKTPPEGKKVGEVETRQMRLPTPLLLAAFAIGLRVAAKWVGYRHLTWMTR